MCTRFVYNGIDKIVGFNFDIDLSVWDHTVITEENRFYIGIKMPDGLYHSFHGINKNGNVGTLLYVHGNENARYIESEDCITISELTEKFIKAEISFDKALDIVKKKKIIYAPDATMQAMLSDKKGLSSCCEIRKYKDIKTILRKIFDWKSRKRFIKFRRYKAVRFF